MRVILKWDLFSFLENQKQARTSIESCIDKIANALSAKTSPSKTSPLEVESGKKRKSTSSENSFATSSSTSVGDKDSIEDDIERSSEMGIELNFPNWVLHHISYSEFLMFNKYNTN